MFATDSNGMTRRRSLLLPVLGLLLPSVVCCSVRSRDSRVDIARTLEEYQAAARVLDANRMAAFYSVDATLFEPGILPIQSRELIRAFIASFPGAKVEIADANTESLEVFNDTAIHWGNYYEKLSFPGQPASEQHGRFVIEWKREESGSWKIYKFFRVPVTTEEIHETGKSVK